MPKIHGTRRELALELKERLTRGPSFSALPGSSDLTFPEEAAKQYKIWAESWILEPLAQLVPELKPASSAKQESELKKCSSCKKPKSDVKKRLDPYREDVDNKKVHLNLCDDCHKQAQDEI